ncbi:hypothetical protein DMA12_19620 [Amycolatopsis balhimycina DSM 5908]|uniref:Uncharacterized protein n=1 Tax=Amycolatopsis balhimycina DSM 5908 TaxID=1081091 RepID=A0A428WJA0_AMYBA|nr:hypothetical protein [Amycolatopsis balhimycina]RSM43158.1 hypothetical protein DMA12_19620 [Amycolatopsis balhimycina DSM 5908]
MTAAPDDGAARYLVLQRKGTLFPAIAAAAYQLVHSPVWRGRHPVDPSPLLATLEAAAVQVAFFSNQELNATLERLVTAGHQFAAGTQAIQARSRPSFGGAVEEPARAEDDAARRALDRAITAFVETARADLGIAEPWLPIHPTSDLHS